MPKSILTVQLSEEMPPSSKIKQHQGFEKKYKMLGKNALVRFVFEVEEYTGNCITGRTLGFQLLDRMERPLPEPVKKTTPKRTFALMEEVQAPATPSKKGSQPMNKKSK